MEFRTDSTQQPHLTSPRLLLIYSHNLSASQCRPLAYPKGLHRGLDDRQASNRSRQVDLGQHLVARLFVARDCGASFCKLRVNCPNEIGPVAQCHVMACE